MFITFYKSPLPAEGCQALTKLANIVCQTLLFISVSLVKDNNVTADLGLKQQCLASNVGQFRQGLTAQIGTGIMSDVYSGWKVSDLSISNIDLERGSVENISDTLGPGFVVID